MNLYQRVATANPSGARNVIQKYGYEIRTKNLSQALRMLVGAEGEPALRDIVAIHPDKDLILECYGDVKKDDHKHDDCKCKEANKHEQGYLNAAGQLTEAQKETQLTNTFLIVSAVMILGALIIRNNK